MSYSREDNTPGHYKVNLEVGYWKWPGFWLPDTSASIDFDITGKLY